MNVIVGDIVEKVQGFNGPDKAVVTKGNINAIDGFVRAGLMKIVRPFRATEGKPDVGESNEDTGLLPIGDKTRKGSRGRSVKPE